MITYKPLSELPIKMASDLWNLSFENYSVDVSMPMDRFIDRVANEGLSLTRSFACYVDEAPAAIVMNGFRHVGESLMAWNGGTAVAPAFRKRGIGKALMQHNQALYIAEGVKRATLEAISSNKSAIHLYEGQGYSVIDQLKLLSCKRLNPMGLVADKQTYDIYRSPAAAATAIPWYHVCDVWQAGLQSLKNGECVFATKDNKIVSYGLIRRVYDVDGSVKGIILYRLETAPDCVDERAALSVILRELWQPELDCKRTVFNIPASKPQQLNILEEMGFSETMEQVLMAN
ncbi:GNAT family N-acetyltransferase [Aureibacillus halotolerans]|uniref:Acetyltransferase (GNAT) family protein n=1 Tax=Aureibacillus halotolerans TaxID=1508390 RepID=A0A4R6TXP4_9BACI|nr:GNAT family N-acetyltransferase [Aureibacillus halotolerans]TDQ38660.1 acetyltransferase (GNAT) family protein [Aureibacillus halotolerans]